MCFADKARTRGACVSSVLCTRVLVCKAQGSERGRGGGEAEASEARCATCLESGNREIGKSGNREIGKYWSRGAPLVDAAAAECQLRRVIDTLAGLPFAIDTLTGASFSRTRAAAIYLQSCAWCWVRLKFWIEFAAMPPCATHPHPKTARREEKSDKKKEERPQSIFRPSCN